MFRGCILLGAGVLIALPAETEILCQGGPELIVVGFEGEFSEVYNVRCLSTGFCFTQQKMGRA